MFGTRKGRAVLAAAIILTFCPRGQAMGFVASPDQKNGVPLGGIGTGHLELLPDGNFANIAINNNRAEKTRVAAPPSGTFFAARVEAAEGTRTVRLSSSAPDSLDAGRLLSPGSIRYEGLYPAARLTYPREETGGRLDLAAFSPIVPFNYQTSNQPAAIFVFTVFNPGAEPMRVSLAFSWENLNGLTGTSRAATDRRRMRPLKTGDEEPPLGMEFSHKGKHSLDSAYGDYVSAVACPDPEGVTYRQWAQDDPAEREAFWADFESDGSLENVLSQAPDAYSGAVVCAFEVKPGATVAAPFALAWDFPRFLTDDFADMGNHYSTHAGGASATALRALARWPDWMGAVDRWQSRILEGTLPDWFKDQLVNNLYVLTTNTLWTRDGRVSVMETPGGPMMGTLDQRFYSSLPTLMLFPLLDFREMDLFADTRHPEDEGRIYHDLGTYRLDRPSTGTTDKKWTDLNPKFILMAWRNYEWTGDLEWLKGKWPKIKKAAEYTMSQDLDGDGLPNQEGRSTTYDDWAYYGSNSYASSLWIAALDVSARMAVLLEEPDSATRFRAALAKAKASFESELWNEELGFYRLYDDSLSHREGADHPKISEGSHAGQLAGQWYADFLDLGKLFPPERIRRALEYMGRLNDRPFGVAKGLMPDGSPSPNPPSEGWRSESENGWPGYWTCHYAALAIANGFADQGMAAVKKAYDGLYVKNGLAWNQPLRWDLEKNQTYGWGQDRYMASPSVWHVLYAIEGFALSLPDRRLRATPNLPAGETRLDAPLLMPNNWGRLRYEEIDGPGGASIVMNLQFDVSVEIQDLVVPGLKNGAAARVFANDGSLRFPEVGAFDEGGRPLLRLHFAEPVLIGPKGLDVVVME